MKKKKAARAPLKSRRRASKKKRSSRAASRSAAAALTATLPMIKDRAKPKPRKRAAASPPEPSEEAASPPVRRSRKKAAASPPEPSEEAASPAVRRKHRKTTAVRLPRAAASPAAPVDLSRCESLAVGAAARKRYDVASQKFNAWRTLDGASEPETTAELQVLLVKYLDVMLASDLPLHDASLAVAAVVDAHPGMATMATLPRVKKALRGFRKVRPPRSRAPICKEIMCGLAAAIMQKGQPRIGILVAMTFFAYCRPGEMKNAVRRQLIPPVRKKGPLSHWTLSLAPQNEKAGAEQAVTKTGVVDDAIIMDQPPWLGALITKWFGALGPDEPLFPEDPNLVLKCFRAACQSLGLPPLCMYQLRHGGASEDLLSKTRDTQAVKARGRWTTDSSVRRYAKPAQLQRLANAMSPEGRVCAEFAMLHFEAIMMQTLPVWDESSE